VSDLYELNTPRLYLPSKPVRDPEYLKFIRALRFCLACGRWRRAEAAHTGTHGIGQKASDLDTVPLCPDCHRELHKLGPVEFQEKWGLVFRAHIERLNQWYLGKQRRKAV